jgi:hypothetical protein
VREADAAGAAPGADYPSARPATRADCLRMPRPCPFVSCRYHLYLDVSLRTGAIFLNATVEPDEMADTCALDVAERGGCQLEIVGRLLGVTRERIRQIESRALNRLRCVNPRQHRYYSFETRRAVDALAEMAEKPRLNLTFGE